MRLLAWVARCTPFLATLFLAILTILALAVYPYGSNNQNGHSDGTATAAQVFLSTYMVALHILALVFPLRLYRAISDLVAHLERTSTGRLADIMSLQAKERASESDRVIFAIILPSYKEELSTLMDTLKVLAAHPGSETTYDVYLATEEKEVGATSKASVLIETFRSSFRNISHTQHPANLPREAQGKSSNVSWAAKELSKQYLSDDLRKDVIITVMDADTHLMPAYFQLVRRMHLDYPSTSSTTLYVPPIIFDRNIHKVPLGVRLADMLWCGAGLSGLHCSSTTSIPTSVYSLPLTLAELVGGWDVGPESIGEDLHMWLKCSLALSANLTTRVVYSPASQCNVDTDVKGLRGYFCGLHARYVQALRHTWGALDIGYMIQEVGGRVRELSRARKDLGVRCRTSLRAENANWTAFCTTYNLVDSLDQKPTQQKPQGSLHGRNSITIVHRLFEAHFLPLHLPITVLSTALYSLSYPPALMPSLLYNAIILCGWLRALGYLSMLGYFILYRRYHRLCLRSRESYMRTAGLYEDFKKKDSFSTSCFPVLGIFEVAIFPISGFLFGSIPAAVAITSHLWTDSLVYVVSIKPQAAVESLLSLV